MPQAKPTQVIVHRIELQQSERQMLKEYVEGQQKMQIIQAASGAAGPALIGAGIAGAAYLGVLAWRELTTALNALDPSAALAELNENRLIRGTLFAEFLGIGPDNAFGLWDEILGIGKNPETGEDDRIGLWDNIFYGIFGKPSEETQS
jgi:hypothetical protein